MKKLTKTLTALLLAGVTLSLMCGCDNGAADNKNSSVSGGSSATQSIASDKSDTSSKDESKTDETSANKSNESNDEEIIEKLKQLPIDATAEDAREILGVSPPDYPAAEVSYASHLLYSKYTIGKYNVIIEDRFEQVDVLNTETNEWINVLYPTKPYKTYDEKDDYPEEVKELAEKLSSITVDSTREDVIKALGDPDETDIEKSQAIHTDIFNGDKYKIVVTYHGKGLLANIRTKDGRLYRNIVYPDRYKNKNNNSSQEEN